MSQLDVATGAFLENDDALWISEARDEVRLTQLFEWYAADFGGSKEEVTVVLCSAPSVPQPVALSPTTAILRPTLG